MTSTLEETFNPAALTRPDAASSNSVTSKANTTTTLKPIKTAQTYTRIDFEPLYTDLKSCIGHNWSTYHDALSRFIRGELSSNEFGYLTDEFIYATPASEHAHNALICAIVHNTGRDSPEIGPAQWVSAASDKTVGMSSGKPTITSDAGEQRLKTEIMALPPRDRRRLKGVGSEKINEEDGGPGAGNAAAASTSDGRGLAGRRTNYEEYYNASRIRAPESVPANTASGLTKTNWELEIKKRYAQPLFSETLEFPDANTIHMRMVPICYEESVAAGSSLYCAELVAVAAEVYLKDFIGNVFNRTRSNGPRYENGAGGGILTSRFKKQVVKEEAEVKSGKLTRGRDDDLLPAEILEAKNRRPLGMSDIKLASRLGPSPWNGMPLMGMQVNEAPSETEYDEWRTDRDGGYTKNGVAIVSINGKGDHYGADEMDIDGDDDYGWEGTGMGDREALGSLLEECLAIRA